MSTIFGMEQSLLFTLPLLYLISILEGFVDTVVDPAVIFYIESVGGTPEDYGKAGSLCYLGMTLMMVAIGNWMSRNNGKYRAPYVFTFLLAIIGSLIYFMASFLPSGKIAVTAILIGKFVMGTGNAGTLILMSWIATAMPMEKHKLFYTIAMLVSALSQTAGPKLNTLVAEIDTSIAITPHYSISLDPLNSVALISAVVHMLVCLLVMLFFKDPPSRKEEQQTDSTKNDAESVRGDVLTALTHFDIAFPIVQMFLKSCNSAFYGLTIAQIAKYMLGWTPVEISKLAVARLAAGVIGLVVMLFMSLVNTPDLAILLVGNMVLMIAAALAYLQWRVDTATVSKFVTPILLFSIEKPFFLPALQSSLNRAVLSKPELAGSIGLLQTIFIMVAAVAGITIPIFVEYFVLRDPDDVSLSSPRELTSWAWLFPISSLLVIIGLFYEDFVMGKNQLGLLKVEDVVEPEDDDEVMPDETSKLVKDRRNKSTRHSIVQIDQVFSQQCEVSRRMSSVSDIFVNGIGIINPLETVQDRELMKKLTSDKQEWEYLLGLDEDADVEMEK